MAPDEKKSNNVGREMIRYGLYAPVRFVAANKLVLRAALCCALWCLIIVAALFVANFFA